MTLTASPTSGFYYWFEASYIRKYATAIFAKLLELVAFWAQMTAVKLGYDRSMHVAIATNFCLSNPHNLSSQ